MTNTETFLIPINPFRIGTSYVNPYLGYQEQLKAVREAIRYKNTLMVTGLPQTGKTTLLKQIEDELQTFTNTYRWLYLDVGGKPYRPQDFWLELAQLLNIEPNDTNQQITPEQSNQTKQKSVNDMNINQKVAEKIFQVSRNIHLILTIDGFDLLIIRDRFPAEFFIILEETFVSKVALLLSSYRTPSTLCAQLATYVKSVPKDFLGFVTDTIYLPGLHPSEIFDFCKYSLNENPVQFTEMETAFIVENSGGIPSLMQWIASAIFDLKLDLFDEEVDSIETLDVIKTVQSNLKENSEWFINYFWPSTPLEVKMGLLLLIVRSKIIETGSRWSPRLIEEILQNFEPLLLSLADYGVLNNIQTPFTFKSKLLQEWITKYSFESNESGRLLLEAVGQLETNRERRRLVDYIQWTGIELAQDIHYSILPQRRKTFQRVIGWVLIGFALILINLVSRYLWELLGIF